MIKQYRTACVATAIVMTLAGATLAGCGGGGGNGGGGNGNGTQTGTSPTTVTKPKVTVTWQALRRGVEAPGDAQSLVVTIPSGQPGGGTYTWTVNRDSSRPDGYTETYTASDSVAAVDTTVSLQFYSGPNGGGFLVGESEKRVDFAGNNGTGSYDLGTLSVSSPVTSVASASSTPSRLAVGGTLDVLSGNIFIAKNLKGASVNVPAERLAVSVAPGSESILAVDNSRTLRGLSAGTGRIIVTAYGVASEPIVVVVGDAAVGTQTSGTRGSIPLRVNGLPPVAGATTAFTNTVLDGTIRNLALDWVGSPSFVVPATYGDRQFTAWQSGGVTLGTNPTLNLTGAVLSSGAPVVAVYSSRSGAGSFAPNFNRTGNLHWGSFPLKVSINANGANREKVLKGLDRWVLATGGAVSYTEVSDAGSADVTIAFGSVPGGASGITASTYEEDTKLLVKAEITLAPTVATENGGSALEGVTAHEFGHALGITGITAEEQMGHSDDPSDTMYAMVNGQQVGFVTERDMNTLTNLYPGLFGGDRSITRKRSGAATATVKSLCKSH